ncbi:phosphatase PAP2 family protein [Pandoraea nosoerga]|uniref:Phosphatase PAP2 family protein n=1 Tax=Pandoraea nosoerga TaxID=2508296 RepID=A0A5E4SMB4_9BURK|nr:phosphatase PAP2 family protein [Pandoraea nosoerga]MBN4665301.1 phosphatase PAP2 family protein [Pandoraea nosoerga]MBN4674701.1 phosphatase PAP2 family protein [Pandoraea nosoerga]MBN4680590.1 phosphatase PAP2 family protein [Pandoraea nosoerga]MBN4743995.1 phosphatase PAP2 family protein [Pandoraea nosoerga]VVD75029.1 phosphatase PAP2 family protein [Pandoraea nosoerga]
MSNSWITITNFGSAAVTVPAAAALTLWLLSARAWRMAVTWGMMFAAGALLVAVSKVMFLGWGMGVRELDFTGVSGHTMLAATVYPTMAWLLLRRVAWPWRVLGMAAAMAGSVAVGVSRVALSAHSISETVAGWVVGFAVCGAFAWFSRRDDAPHLKALPMAASLFVLVMWLHGERVPTQRWITHIALKLSGRDQPFRRASWHARKPVAPVPSTSPTPAASPVTAPATAPGAYALER